MRPLRELSLGDWVDALARQTPVPAGGALALATLAGAAALTGKMASLRHAENRLFTRLAGYFLTAADEDASNYADALAGRADAPERCLSADAEHLEKAVLFLEELGGTFRDLPPDLGADVAGAAGLARAAARTLLVNLAVNLSAWERAANAPAVAALLEELKTRLQGV